MKSSASADLAFKKDMDSKHTRDSNSDRSAPLNMQKKLQLGKNSASKRETVLQVFPHRRYVNAKTVWVVSDKNRAGQRA